MSQQIAQRGFKKHRWSSVGICSRCMKNRRHVDRGHGVEPCAGRPVPARTATEDAIHWQRKSAIAARNARECVDRGFFAEAVMCQQAACCAAHRARLAMGIECMNGRN